MLGTQDITQKDRNMYAKQHYKHICNHTLPGKGQSRTLPVYIRLVLAPTATGVGYKLVVTTELVLLCGVFSVTDASFTWHVAITAT